MLFKTHCVIQATSNSIQDMCHYNCCCLAESLRYDISEQCVVFFLVVVHRRPPPLAIPTSCCRRLHCTMHGPHFNLWTDSRSSSFDLFGETRGLAVSF